MRAMRGIGVQHFGQFAPEIAVLNQSQIKKKGIDLVALEIQEPKQT